MPVSPSLAENLASDLLEAYTGAEVRVIELVAKFVAKGLDSPDWADEKLADISRLRRLLQVISGDLSATALGLTTDAINAAWQAGDDATLADLNPFEALKNAASKTTPNTAAINHLVRDAYNAQRPLFLRVVRAPIDAYREVIRKTTANVVLGVDSRRSAAYKAMREFAKQGITGFVDKAGRQWQLSSYSEMALRTVTARAVVDASSERLKSAGLNLVIVSNAPQECKLCRPFEGKIFTLDSPGERLVKTKNVITGEIMSIRTMGSLEDARAKGLYHPNCRHSHSAYLPGVTKPIIDTEDVQGDKDRQTLRALERRKREALRIKAAAISPEDKKQATADVKAITDRIIEHTDNTTAKRQTSREHLGPR
jgi:minor capsid protein 2